MAQVKSDRPAADLYRVNGQWYTDERGNVGRFTTLEQIEAGRRYAQIQAQNEGRIGRHYVNCYHEPIRDITHKLKLNELGALLKLLPFLRFKKDGLLVKSGKPMTAADIAKVIGKSQRQASAILAKLIDEGVIVKEGERRGTRYYIAEEYHTIGYTREGLTYTKLYQRETRLRADKLAIQEAGLLYKMLPYFHYDNYFLCANPDADERTEEIEHLNQSQLADLIGESADTVRRGVNALMASGFLMKISGYNTSRILVNPDVMFRAEYETPHTETVRRQFYELERGQNEVH